MTDDVGTHNLSEMTRFPESRFSREFRRQTANASGGDATRSCVFPGYRDEVGAGSCGNAGTLRTMPNTPCLGVLVASAVIALAAWPAGAMTANAGGAVFPSKAAPKYASQSAGRARMHTCLDQYHANKAAKANGGLAWIQKGGGYYSACSKHLHG